MAIKVIAQRRVLKIGKNPGVKKFVMRPELYTPIQEKRRWRVWRMLRRALSVRAASCSLPAWM